jgi:hypothetical protein
MKRHVFIIGTAVVALLIGTVGRATDTGSRTLQVHCKGAGTFADGVETNIDTNGDGVSATLNQGLENCRPLGRLFFHQEEEWIRQDAVTSACPAGTTDEFHINATQGQTRGVATKERTGDQLFGKITSGTLCLNFSSFPNPPFPTTASGQTEIIGGTGRFAGATGTGTFTSVGSFLQFGFKGGEGGPFGGFGQFTFTSNGTLTLPQRADQVPGDEDLGDEDPDED